MQKFHGLGLPGWLSGKRIYLPAQETQVWSLGREDPWSRKWQPTPVFLHENSMDRGAWWAPVRGVTKSWTCLSMHTQRHWNHTEFVLLSLPSHLFLNQVVQEDDPTGSGHVMPVVFSLTLQPWIGANELPSVSLVSSLAGRCLSNPTHILFNLLSPFSSSSTHFS